MHINRITVISTLLVLFGHFLGVFFNLYNTLYYHDTLLHFLSGVWVASIILYFCTHYPSLSFFHSRAFWNLILTTSITLSIGVVWEFFEFFLSKVLRNTFVQNIYTDTLTDLVADTCGGFVLALIFFFFLSKKKMKERN